MPVTQAVTPKMKTVVSSCSFLALIGLERAIDFVCLEKGCHGHVGCAGKANTLHQKCFEGLLMQDKTS